MFFNQMGHFMFITYIPTYLLTHPLWGDFPSLYSWFYKVIMLESTNVIDERKNANLFQDVRLRL